MGSTRLPGKVFFLLSGKPVMQHVYERIGYCQNLDRIIVATSVNTEDDCIAEWFDRLGVCVFRGSAEDPLDRYYQAASAYHAKHVVRIMADCPLVDPMVVDEVIAKYFDGGYDLCYLGGEFPTGLDVTVFSYEALERSWKEARLVSEREHVTPYMSKNPGIFKVGCLEKFQGLLRHRWVMDYRQDYEFIRQIYEALYEPGKIFLSNDVLKLIEGRPHLMKINAGIPRDEGYRKAVEREAAATVSSKDR
jgi:spore coat polysaccharide biosynthesis protein SpsF